VPTFKIQIPTSETSIFIRKSSGWRQPGLAIFAMLCVFARTLLVGLIIHQANEVSRKDAKHRKDRQVYRTTGAIKFSEAVLNSVIQPPFFWRRVKTDYRIVAP
jgi:hypothetical protein